MHFFFRDEGKLVNDIGIGSHPSSSKTLPPTSMGFGGTGIDAIPNDVYHH